MTESRGSNNVVRNLATITVVKGMGCFWWPGFRSVLLQLHALKKGKGPLLKGISDYQEKNVARQVKATADHRGWRVLVACSGGWAFAQPRSLRLRHISEAWCGQGRLRGGNSSSSEAWAVGRMQELGSGRTEVRRWEQAGCVSEPVSMPGPEGWWREWRQVRLQLDVRGPWMPVLLWPNWPAS